MKRIIKSFSFVACILLLVSCNDWLTIIPKNDVVRDKVFESEQGFRDAVSGIYLLMRENNYGMTGELTFGMTENLAGFWEYSNKSVQEELAQHRYKKDDVDKFLGDLFQRQYRILANLNSMVEFFDIQTCLSAADYNLYKGEVLALRAFLHFDLIRLWGPMPTQASQTKLYLPYETTFTHIAHTYYNYPKYMKLLQEDLDNAEEYLLKSDPILTMPLDSLNTNKEQDGLAPWGYFRQYKFNYYAVLALQARVHLWMNDKAEAFRYAKMVTEAKQPNGKPVFPLTAIIEDNVIECGNNSEKVQGHLRALYPEHIMGMQMVMPNYHIDAIWGANGKVRYITKEKKDAIYGNDTLDVRRRFWHEDWSGRTGCVVPMKYNNYDMRSLPLIRVAEMYLILMECAPLDEANLAYQQLFASRHRFDMKGFEAMTEDNRLAVVVSEYYKELCVEGQVFYMNKRLGSEYVKWSALPMGQSQYELPIPTAEINY